MFAVADIRWALPQEKEEIIDFIDYVFSKAHRPHDFATLLPKLYGGQGDAAAHHIIVREEGMLVAVLLCYPVAMHAGGKQYMTLGIGSVSTHPRARAKGYLGEMMRLADERAKEMNAAFAVLGGQRQRYQYYGFDHAGYQLRARLETDNVRHALRNVAADGIEIAQMTQDHVPAALALLKKQPCYCARGEAAYLEILRSWYNEPFAVIRDGKAVGFGTKRKNQDGCHVAELLLERETDFPVVMKRLSQLHGDLSICAAPWERERAKWLAAVCEEYALQPNNMFKIYDAEQADELCAALDSFAPIAQPLYVAPPDCV